MIKLISLITLLTSSASMAKTCTANCVIFCESVVFTEVEEDFTPQKCKDLGGQPGGLREGKYSCISKHDSTPFTVKGQGKFTYQAMELTKKNCAAKLPNNCLKESALVSTTDYKCE